MTKKPKKPRIEDPKTQMGEVVKRDPQGRFLERPKNAGRGPRHSYWTRQFNRAVKAKVAEEVQKRMAASMEVVDAALKEGDTKVAMWLIDRLGTTTHTIIPAGILDEITLSSVDQVIDAGQIVAHMGMSGKITVEEADRALNMLMNYCKLRAYERIDELQELVESFENMAQSGVPPIQGGLMPKWGNLTEGTKTANDKPAE